MQPTKIKTIVYRVTTGMLGAATLARLVYLAYFATGPGYWKLLGAIALLLPGLPAWLIFGPDGSDLVSPITRAASSAALENLE